MALKGVATSAPTQWLRQTRLERQKAAGNNLQTLVDEPIWDPWHGDGGDRRQRRFPDVRTAGIYCFGPATLLLISVLFIHAGFKLLHLTKEHLQLLLVRHGHGAMWRQ